MGPTVYLEELKKALNEYRFADIEPLTNQIVPSEFSEKQVTKALSLLRQKRRFAELEKTASLFALSGFRGVIIRRQWTQALLDQNRVAQALCALEAMLPEVTHDPKEGSEVRGLIGRAYKQLYVNEGNKQHLVNAIASYRPGWIAREGDYRWHGINLVALLARAERDEVDPQVSERMAIITHRILDEIKADIHSNSAGVWDYGTAMEGAVALGDKEEALRWARQYVRHPDADAFEISSTLRQLKEVWNLEGSETGRVLLPVLEYELLQREGGVLQLTATKVSATQGFEAVYGTDSSIPMAWMDTMYSRCRAVVRVFDTATGQCWGTGFVLKGSMLNQAWRAESILVTNAHVISNNAADESPLKPGDASVEFTRIPSRPTALLGDLLYSSPRVELDVSVFRLQAPADAAALEPSFYQPALAIESDKPQRIYVVGHPNGGELAVSLYDNSLVGYEGPYVHYRSPTEGGSSGSPVFTRQWKLFAIHHRAREALKVNEGVLLEPIKNQTTIP